MGFFNKLKSVASAITGGGAKVFIEPANPTWDSPFQVRVRAVVGDRELKINRVYVKLQGQETIIARSVPVAHGSGSQVQVNYEDVQQVNNTFEQDFNIAGAQTLNPNQEYSWEAEVHFPPNTPPSYQGRNARHELKILAGLDAPGNDPDSGWTNLFV